MRGPEILTRSLSTPVPMGRERKLWQYHSRSDRHSKIACWCILFDLLEQSALLREHASKGEIGFGINHTMRDFHSNRQKDLDLVICVPDESVSLGRPMRTFELLGDAYDIVLTEEEREAVQELPELHEAPVGSVRAALEAKACMTEHSKARPRLFDELRSSHEAIHGAAATAIAVGFVMVNASETFQSPSRSEISNHVQPRAAKGILAKLEELPRRRSTAETGFDAIGVIVVDCKNDGVTPVRLISDDPAPQPGDLFHYEQMIRRIVQYYESRFPLR